MPVALADSLLAPDTRPQVVTDSLDLIHAELGDKSGIAGNALKLAYKTVNGFRPGYIRHTVNRMLPRIVEQLQPYWADFTASGGSQFGDYLAKRGDEVAQSLLSISDGMAENSDKPVVVKAYRTVRGSAARHIEAALPRLGDLVVKYAG